MLTPLIVDFQVIKNRLTFTVTISKAVLGVFDQPNAIVNPRMVDLTLFLQKAFANALNAKWLERAFLGSDANAFS